MEERKILTPQSVQQDLDALGAIQNSRRGQADPPLCQGTGGGASPDPETCFDRAAVSSNLLLCKLPQQIKDVAARMAFIHNNLLFTDWWHTDQIIRYVAALDFRKWR